MALYDVVFEGGGAKGVAFAGALEVFFGARHTIRRTIGTSAGAITAALVAAGFTPEEMKQVVTETLPSGEPRFTSFMDAPSETDFSQADLDSSVTQEFLKKIDIPLVPKAAERWMDRQLLGALMNDKHFRKLFSFVEQGGFFSGAAFRQWMEEQLATKSFAPGITLGEFAAQAPIELSVVVSDTTNKEMLVLNSRTAPGVPVSWAVRMSMSIPFVWQEVEWQAAWGPYRGRDKSGAMIVDGGVLSNFPINLLDNPVGDEQAEIAGDHDPAGALNLGLLIDEARSVAGQPEAAKQRKFPELRTVERTSRLVDTMRRASDNSMILKYENDICRVPAKGFGTLEFDMKGARLDDFLGAARQAMSVHLGDNLT